MTIIIIVLISYGSYFTREPSKVDSSNLWTFEKFQTYFGEKSHHDTLIPQVSPLSKMPKNHKYMQSRDSIQTVWLPDSAGGVVAPSELVYNSNMDRMYIISGGRYAPNIAVCEAQSGNLLAVIHLDWRIASIACSETSNKLYCANGDGTIVGVIDCLTNQMINTVSLPSSSDALVWSTAEDEIYCTQEGNYSVQIIDCADDSLIDSVSIGGYPRVLNYNPISNKIYCYASSGILAIIDASNHNLIRQIAVDPGSYHFTLNKFNNRIYCINQSDDNVAIIDGIGDTLICSWQLGQFPLCADYNSVMNRVYIGHLSSENIYIFDGNTNQHIETLYFNAPVLAMAYDSTDNQLFVVTEPYQTEDFFADMIVLDGTTNAIIDTMETGILPWNSMMWEREYNQVWVANEGFDNLPGYTIDGYAAESLEHRFKTAVGFTPYSAILNPATEKYYCVGRSDNFVVVFNTNTPDSCALKEMGECAWDILLNPLENKVYCANNTGRDVTVIDGATDSIITRVRIPGDALALAFNSTDNKIYASSGLYPESGYITVIDGHTNVALNTISVPLSPYSMVWNSSDNKLYISSYSDNTITILDAHADTILTSLVAPSPWSLEYNTISDKIYCSLVSSVIIIDGISNEVITTLFTGPRTFTFTYNSINNKVYCATGDRITVIDGATDSIINTIYISGFKYSLLFNPVTNTVFCAYVYPSSPPRPDGIIVIDGATDVVLANFPIAGSHVWAMGIFGGICSPRKALLLDSLHNTVYLSHYFSSRISVIDGETGIHEQSITTPLTVSLKIFPNPAVDIINIEMSLPYLHNTQMTIFDVAGRMIESFDLPGKNFHRIAWDGTDEHGDKLPGGVYFLKINAEDYTETKKFVLLR
ncbi:MAG: T9SS type A sorting domain-containing protein [bacterium]